MPKQLTAFLCESNPGIAMLTQGLLRGYGYNVIAFNEGAEVYNKIKEIKPDIVLMEIAIADVTGDSITLLLKADAETKHIPVILLSSFNIAESIAKSVGADGFLKKPFKIEEMEYLLNSFVVKQRA